MHCNVSLSKLTKWQEAVFKLKVCGFELPNTQSSHVKLCKPSKPTKTTNASASQQWDSSYHLWNICRCLPIIQVGIRRLEIYWNGQRVYICIFVYLEERDGANVRQKVRARLNRVVLWRMAVGRRRSGWQNPLPRFRQYGRRTPLIRTQTHNLQWAKQYVGLPPQTGWGTILGSYVQWSLEERFPCNWMLLVLLKGFPNWKCFQKKSFELGIRWDKEKLYVTIRGNSSSTPRHKKHYWRRLNWKLFQLWILTFIFAPCCLHRLCRLSVELFDQVMRREWFPSQYLGSRPL